MAVKVDTPTPRRKASVAKLSLKASWDFSLGQHLPTRSPCKEASPAHLCFQIPKEEPESQDDSTDDRSSIFLQEVDNDNLSIGDNWGLSNESVSLIPSTSTCIPSSSEATTHRVTSIPVHTIALYLFTNADFPEASSPAHAKNQFHSVTADRISFYMPQKMLNQLPIGLRDAVMKANRGGFAALFETVDEPTFHFILCSLRPIDDWYWPERSALFPTIEQAAQFARAWEMQDFTQRVVARAFTALPKDPWAMYGVAIALDNLQLGAHALGLIDETIHGSSPDDITQVIFRRNEFVRSIRPWHAPNAQIALRVETFRQKMITERCANLDWDGLCARNQCTPFRVHNGDFNDMYAFIADFVFERVQKGNGEAISLAQVEKMRAFANLVLPCRRCVNRVVKPLSRYIAATSCFIHTMKEAVDDVDRLQAIRERLSKSIRLLETTRL